jgi:UDP-glucose:tetrahydrobiopterin glucosyltransferase
MKQARMRIALIAPLIAPIAPPYLAGVQVVLRDLAAGLAARGHTVTLYAARGSAVPGVRVLTLGIDAAEVAAARLNIARLTATDAAEPADATFFTQAHHFLRIALRIARTAGSYDLLHAHAYDWPIFAFGALLPLPVLHTLHNAAISPAIVGALAALARAGSGNTRLASVSRACAATYAPPVRVPTILRNGIAVDAVPFGPAAAEPRYLLFAGRMSPEKGLEDAVAIARRAGRRLLVAGGAYDPEYFATRARPLLADLEAAGQGEYLGPVPRERLWALMAGAEALLCPIHWDEPFGLVAVEAQAAGAPVVGYARGALPEVVADGVTGWLVPEGDAAEAARAVERAGTLDRAACRARVAELFSLDAMLAAHERVYTELVGA